MVAGPISKKGALLAMGLALGVVAVAVWRWWRRADLAVVATLMALMTTPLWVVASMLAGIVTVTDDRIARRGLVRTADLPWEDVRRVSAQAGRHGVRQLVVHGPRRKVTLSNAMPGFRDTAAAILDAADERDVPVTTPRGMTRERWLDASIS